MTDAEVFDDIVTRRRAVRILQADVPVPDGVISAVYNVRIVPKQLNLRSKVYWVRNPEKATDACNLSRQNARKPPRSWLSLPKGSLATIVRRLFNNRYSTLKRPSVNRWGQRKSEC